MLAWLLGGAYLVAQLVSFAPLLPRRRLAWSLCGLGVLILLAHALWCGSPLAP